MHAHRFRATRPHLAILAALVLGSATCLVAAAAQATVKTAKPKSTSIDEGELAGVKGKCPKGTSVVSGGFSSPDFFTRGSLVVRTTSVRAGKRGWKVTGAGLGSATGRMLSHAYCDTEGIAVRTRKASARLADGKVRSVKASCRKGEGVLSGGFAVPSFKAEDGPQVAIVSSHRAGKRGWTVRAAQPDDTPGGPYGPVKVIAYAYCSADAPKISTARKTVKRAPSDDKGAVIVAKCRNGTKAISGGFRGHLEVEGDGTALGSTAVSSTRVGKGRGWRTEALVVSEIGAVPLTGFAYCAKP